MWLLLDSFIGLLLLDVHQFFSSARFVRCSLESEDLKEVMFFALLFLKKYCEKFSILFSWCLPFGLFLVHWWFICLSWCRHRLLFHGTAWIVCFSMVANCLAIDNFLVQLCDVLMMLYSWTMNVHDRCVLATLFVYCIEFRIQVS